VRGVWLSAGLCAAILIAGGLALAALVQGRAELEPQVRSVQQVPVVVRSVQPAARQLVVETHGTVGAATTASLSAEVRGRVAHLAPELELGARVAAGTVLVELDRRELELTRLAARAEVAASAAALERERAEGQIAERDLERAGVAEPSALARREPQRLGAEAQLAAAEAALARAELDLERTRLSAPFEALITARAVELGQVVSPGAALVQLCAVDAFELAVPLTARDRAALPPLALGLAEGPAATVEVLDGERRGTFVGRVVRTLPELDPRSRALVAIVRVESPLDTGAVPLRLGEFATVRLAGRALPAAVELPDAALRGLDRLWLADGEDRLRQRTVQVAQRVGTTVVIEAGLAAGERVILSPLEAGLEGLELAVRDEPSPGREPAPGSAP
jgi:RND family efflux transporter MFP subunit